MALNINSLVVYLILSAGISSCANIPSPSQRLLNASHSAHQKDWELIGIKGEPFDLAGFTPRTITKSRLLTVYIEGDGLAWINHKTPSKDPTPIHPIGLSLALTHHPGNAAYLARPCQFTGVSNGRGCERTYWTGKRFSAEVIEANNIALDTLKRKFGAEQLQLIGFSGGGAIATLVSAKRTDVIRIITIAGNLDHKTWTTQHRISPLTGSLNPADYWFQLQNIPQIHFVGQDDDIMKPGIAYAYRSRFTTGIKPKIVVIPGVDHSCCWVKHWPDLLFAMSDPNNFNKEYLHKR